MPLVGLCVSMHGRLKVTRGKKTRGKTAPGRLRALDQWLCRTEVALLTRAEGAWAEACVVDVGFGAHPTTTLEMAQTFESVAPGLSVLGVENDPRRVEAARALDSPARVHFVEGGFTLPLSPQQPARLVRAMNVLRQYSPQDCHVAHRKLTDSLLEGGLLVEGSCDKHGDLLTVHLCRKTTEGYMREAIMFFFGSGRGFAPVMFRDWLPRDLRRCVVPGQAITDFLGMWTQAWSEVRAVVSGPREAFAASARLLAQRCSDVVAEPWMWDAGYVCWRPEGGVPFCTKDAPNTPTSQMEHV